MQMLDLSWIAAHMVLVLSENVTVTFTNVILMVDKDREPIMPFYNGALQASVYVCSSACMILTFLLIEQATISSTSQSCPQRKLVTQLRQAV
jgi:hypothetical protein